MVEYKLLLFLVFLVSNTNGQFRANQNQVMSRDRANELDQITNQMTELSQKSHALRAKNEELKHRVQQLKQECAQELLKMDKEFEAMMMKSNEGLTILSDLLKKLQAEEAEHIKLEAELKRISEIMEVLLYQHQILHSDFKLGQKRNKETGAQCREVTTKLAELAQENFVGRSLAMNPYKIRRKAMTKQDREIMKIQNRLGIDKNLYNKLVKHIESVEREFQAEQETCGNSKEQKQMLLKDTLAALQTQEQSIQVLKNDLDDAIKLSETMRTEISQGKQFLNELSQRNDQIKLAMKDFHSDTQCFHKIKEME